MKLQVLIICINKIGTLGGIFEILELWVGSIVGFYASKIFKKNLWQEILNYEKELKEIKKILSQTQKADENSSSHHIKVIEEEKKNEDEDEYEGGESSNFSRIKPYQYQLDNSRSK